MKNHHSMDRVKNAVETIKAFDCGDYDNECGDCPLLMRVEMGFGHFGKVFNICLRRVIEK